MDRYERSALALVNRIRRIVGYEPYLHLPRGARPVERALPQPWVVRVVPDKAVPTSPVVRIRRGRGWALTTVPVSQTAQHFLHRLRAGRYPHLFTPR